MKTMIRNFIAALAVAITFSATAQSVTQSPPAPGYVPQVTSRTSLASAIRATVILNEGLRSGTFVRRTTNLSAEVGRDTQQCVYVPFASDTSGASGAYVRVYSGPINVLWCGADPTNVADSANAIKGARDLLQYNANGRGGTILIPRGYYKVNSTVAFTAYAAGQVHNMWIVGEGPDNTRLDFSGAGINTDGITFDPGVHFGVKGLTITGARRDAISINPGATPGAGTYSQQFMLENFRIQSSVNAGLKIVNAFMGTISDGWVTGNADGVVLNGFSTSLNVSRVFSDLNTNTAWTINGLTYSTFTDTGADTSTYGYAISNVSAVSFVNAGAESNSRNGFLIQTNTASVGSLPTAVTNIVGLSLINVFTFHNSLGSSGIYAAIQINTANSRPANVHLIDHVDVPNSGADYSYGFAGTSGAITVIKENVQVGGLQSVSGAVTIELDAVSCTIGISFGGGTTGLTYGARACSYIIDNGVQTTFFDVPLTAKGSSTGLARITGLPAASGFTTGALGYYTGMTGITGALAYISNNGGGNTTADVMIQGATGVVTATEANFTNTSRIIGTIVTKQP